MMLRCIPYQAAHLRQIDLQEGQMYLYADLSPGMCEALEGPYSFSALDGEEVVCCAGLIEMWKNRALAWAYFAGEITPHRFVAVHRMVSRFLDACPFDRVEATVDAHFEEGHRWIKKLGFVLEAPVMKKYRPDGGDSAQYARVRG